MMKRFVVVSIAFFLLLLTAILVLSQTKQSSPLKPLVFTNVTVIDATGTPARPNMTIVVSQGVIVKLGKTGKVRIPEGAQIIDGAGKFIIPGLWDMHAHLSYYGEAALPLLVANGVTGVRDMGGNLDEIDKWRQEIKDQKRAGPYIIRSGPFVDGPKKMDAFRTSITIVVNNEAEARSAVSSLKKRGGILLRLTAGFRMTLISRLPMKPENRDSRLSDIFRRVLQQWKLRMRE
jgi:hypothetical protein